MTIVELLERTYSEFDAMFQEVDAAAAAGKLRLARERFRRLSTKVLGCAHAEHAIVYPRLAFGADLGHEVATATREHARIEQAIVRLRLAALAPDAWRTAVRELRRLVAEHAVSEQWVLFPIATLALTREQLRGLADEFRVYEPRAAAVAGVSITYDADDLTAA